MAGGGSGTWCTRVTHLISQDRHTDVALLVDSGVVDLGGKGDLKPPSHRVSASPAEGRSMRMHNTG